MLGFTLLNPAYPLYSKPGLWKLGAPSRKALQRQRDKLRDIIQQHRGAPQAGLVYALNPVIQGWANYYQYCVAKHDFQILDNTLYHQLTRWARYRHPRKSGKWCYRRYRRKVNGRVRFSDGEWVYWSTRLGRDPSKPTTATTPSTTCA